MAGELSHRRDARSRVKEQLEEPPAVPGNPRKVEADLRQRRALEIARSLSGEKIPESLPSRRDPRVDEGAYSQLSQRQGRVGGRALRFSQQCNGGNTRKLSDHRSHS